MVHRWRLEDPSDPNPATNTYVFPINPNAMTSLHAPRAIMSAVTTALDGQALFFEGRPKPQEWTFSGDILDRFQYEALRSWVQDRKRRLYLYDHFGRRITLQLVEFSAVPKRSHGYYWRHTYDVKALVIDISHAIVDNHGRIDGTMGDGYPTYIEPVDNSQNPPPVAHFTTTSDGATVTFSAMTSTDDIEVVGAAWTFGDGTTGTGKTVTHTYTDSGSYAVTLTVTDDGGLTGTTTDQVVVTVPEVIPPPVAGFTTDATGLQVTTTDTSTGQISSWLWNFGDGATSSVTNAEHTYATAGTYIIGLTVTGPTGISRSTTRAIIVTGVVDVTPPTADFTVNQADLTVYLANTSSAANGLSDTRSWDFGDGTASTDAAPEHTYATAGTYMITLTVTDNQGVTASKSAPVILTSSVIPAVEGGDPRTTGNTSGLITDDTWLTEGTWVTHDAGTTVALSTIDDSVSHVNFAYVNYGENAFVMSVTHHLSATPDAPSYIVIDAVDDFTAGFLLHTDGTTWSVNYMAFQETGSNMIAQGTFPTPYVGSSMTFTLTWANGEGSLEAIDAQGNSLGMLWSQPLPFGFGGTFSPMRDDVNGGNFGVGEAIVNPASRWGQFSQHYQGG